MEGDVAVGMKVDGVEVEDDTAATSGLVTRGRVAGRASTSGAFSAGGLIISSGKLERRESPADTCWHIALTASVLGATEDGSVSGEVSGIGATASTKIKYNF